MPNEPEVGFDRPKAEPLRDTVKFYQRHLFLCTGTTGWPAHIEVDGGFAQTLSEAISAQPRAAGTKLTACDEAPSGPPGTFDLLVFPEQVRYLGLSLDSIPILAADHLATGHVSRRLAHEPVRGHHIFVCVHGARDARCGACGPPLAGLFLTEVARRGLAGSVYVHRTSHVGGHQYAGNVIIYPEGDWYGYVTPSDVPRIVEQHILQGIIIADLWRGRMSRV